MWEPRCRTTLLASTACYRDSFTNFLWVVAIALKVFSFGPECCTVVSLAELVADQVEIGSSGSPVTEQWCDSAVFERLWNCCTSTGTAMQLFAFDRLLILRNVLFLKKVIILFLKIFACFRLNHMRIAMYNPCVVSQLCKKCWFIAYNWIQITS
jgi:hypothetical protein